MWQQQVLSGGSNWMSAWRRLVCVQLAQDACAGSASQARQQEQEQQVVVAATG
jgi:hypothetical protein